MSNFIIVKDKEEAYKPQYVAYGTEVFYITREQIQALLDGKVLVNPDPEEYGTVVMLED